jgi:membrane-bound metal-dependent hydrolase YbcI (DUF457 family)
MFAFPGHFGVGLIVSGLTNFSIVPIMIGSLLPDIDGVLYMLGFDYRKTHRTFTHSIFMPLLISIFSFPLALGIVFHMLADLLFYPGIKLFYPISKKDFYFIRGKGPLHQTPGEFIKYELKRKRFIAYEVSILTIGVLLFIVRH